MTQTVSRRAGLTVEGHPVFSETRFTEPDAPHNQQPKTDAAQAGESLYRNERVSSDRERQHERQTDCGTDRDHAHDRPETEDQNVSDSLTERTGSRDNDQQEGSRSGQPVRHADEERPSRLSKPVGMGMVVMKHVPVEMYMLPPMVLVTMYMPPLPVQPAGQPESQPNQHEADEQLKCRCQKCGNGHMQRQDTDAHEQQHQGMAQPPEQSDDAGRPEAGALGKDGRDSDDMIGIQRMA
jgi:hypothetical protein